MEEIPAGECSYVYLTGDFSFGRLPEEEQLVVIPLLMRTLRMGGLGERSFGPLHPEGEEATEVRLRYSGFREGDFADSSLTYTTRYFSLYERPGILIENPFRRAKSIAELAQENVLGIISRSLFIGGRVIYPPRDEVLMSLQVPTGDSETDRHMRALVKCANNLAIQKFRSLANWIFRGVYDFVSGVVRQTAAVAFLGSRIPKKVRRRVEIWTNEHQRRSMSRSAAEESEQLLGLCRSVTLTHEEQYYALRMARYPQAREEDMRRRQMELDRSTAWAIARNQDAARDTADLAYSPTSPGAGACIRDTSSDDDLFDSDS